MYMCKLFLLIVFFTSSLIRANPTTLVPITLKGGTDNNIVSAMAMSPDGSVQAIAYADRGIYIWESGENYVKKILTKDKVRAIAVDNQKNILVGCIDGQLLYYDFNSDVPKIIMHNRGMIAAVKWGRNTHEMYVLYQTNKNLSGDKYLSHLTVDNNGDIVDREIVVYKAIKNINLNADYSIIITESYHTNRLAEKNQFMTLDAQTLEKNVYITSGPEELQSFFGVMPESIGVLQGKHLEYSAHQNVIEFSADKVIKAGYCNEDTQILIAGRDKTIRFMAPERNPTASIWPFFGSDVVMSLDGKRILTFDDEQGLLQLWMVETTSTDAYADVLSSQEYKRLEAPSRKPHYGERDVNCRLENGQLILNAAEGVPSFYTIYWSTSADDGELVEKGIYSHGLKATESVPIALTHPEASACSASYFTGRPSGP